MWTIEDLHVDGTIFWGDPKRGAELYGTTPGLAEMEDETGTEGNWPTSK